MPSIVKVTDKKKRIPIYKLLKYWIDISTRSILTVEDYRLFFEMAEVTAEYFSKYHIRDNFIDGIDYMVFTRDKVLKAATKKKRLDNKAHALMKGVAKKFIPRIKKWFGADIVASIDRKTPLQDAEDLLAYSEKLTYRRAAGSIASNYLADLLIQLSAFRPGEKYTDDIITLYANLKNRTTNRKLKTFLTRSYRRFGDADKTRNRCAHIIEGDPTKQEIEQSIALARLLRKFTTRRF
jgi:hypothetical protein